MNTNLWCAFFPSACPGFPTLPSQAGIQCGIANTCKGFECCADVDLIVTAINIRVYLLVDFCNYEASVGFGEWFSNFTFFAYDLGTEKTYILGSATIIR